MTRSVVYLIRASSGGPCKIGVTRNLRNRLAGLRNASFHDLEVIRTVEGSFETENWFHDRFAHKRISREWFEFDPDMLEVIPPDLDGVPEMSLCGPASDPIAEDWREQFRKALTRGVHGSAREIERLTGCDKRVAENYLYGKHLPPMHILLRLMATLPEVAGVIISLTKASHQERLLRALEAMEVARRELESEAPAPDLTQESATT